MSRLKIGIIREGKKPIDRRVPLTPDQISLVEKKFGVKVFVQSSDVRCFSDQEYEDAGASIVDTVNHCDILFGVKEVPIDELIPEKTYFFFSHTIKKQEYNRNLLRKILELKIKLIDYEVLKKPSGSRLIAFGRYAGIVGAYNGLWTYGKRYNLYHTRRAHECYDLNELKGEYNKIVLPKIKIALTGGGRVARGSMEVLNGVGIRKVSPEAFLKENFPEPVYCQLNSRDFHTHKNGELFNRK
jgi:alanine dehydrogenase